MGQDKRIKLEPASFRKLVNHFESAVELIAEGESLAPWKGEEPSEKNVFPVLQAAGKHLPLVYQQRYLQPLKDNLGSILIRAQRSLSAKDTPVRLRKQFTKTIEVLAGAVYCHLSEQACDRPLRAFLAVISNTFRSFLPADLLFRDGASPLADLYPPLAAFREGEEAPYMLSSSAVKRLSGGTVGVVVMPTGYMRHPLLWTAVAHEVGGHELLNAVPHLLRELQKGVRQLFNVRSLRSGEKPDLEQLVGLIWQYWAEETISDVCGVLHVGPSYGLSLSIYQAALFHAIATRQGFEKHTLLRLWSGKFPPQFFARIMNLDDVPLPELDVHPTDILKIHVIIGAIENLTTMRHEHRQEYVDYLKDIAKMCVGNQDEIQLYGSLEIGPDRWIRVAQTVPLSLMQDAARRVGAYITTAELNALGGRSLQQLETWSDIDETAAHYTAHSILQGKMADVAGMGDDSILLAASTLAFAAAPDGYEKLSEVMMDALDVSCARDPYWGVSEFHSLIDLPDRDLAESLSATGELLSTLEKR